MPRPPAPPVKPVNRGPSPALIGGVVVLVVALIAVLVWAATRDAGELGASGSGGALPEGGGVSIGAGLDADVPQIRIYEDFQCPWCGVLERSVGEGLADKIQAGEVNVTYQIMSFLDGSLRNDSSTRAANAALCADDAGVFVPFHGAVFANQPPQEGTGWTDDQLVSFGRDAGLSGDALSTFEQCVADQPHADYVTDMQTRANQDGVTGTPTMFVNGEKITDQEMNQLMQDPASLDGVLAAHP